MRVGPLMDGSQGLGSMRSRRALLEMTKTQQGMSISAACLDSDPYLLGVANGVVDLRTGKLYKSRQEALVTLYIEGEYDPDQRIDSKVWDQFVLVHCSECRLSALSPALLRFDAGGLQRTGDVHYFVWAGRVR